MKGCLAIIVILACAGIFGVVPTAAGLFIIVVILGVVAALDN